MAASEARLAVGAIDKLAASRASQLERNRGRHEERQCEANWLRTITADGGGPAMTSHAIPCSMLEKNNPDCSTDGIWDFDETITHDKHGQRRPEGARVGEEVDGPTTFHHDPSILPRISCLASGQSMPSHLVARQWT